MAPSVPVNIRPARPADADAVHGLLAGIIAEGDRLMSDAPPDPDHFRRFVAANLAAGSPFRVAEVKGLLVGWADLVPRTEPSRRHVGRVGMGVARPWRSQGIGRRLLGALIEDAGASGCLRLELEVFTHNATAVGLYRAMGFQEEGRHLAVRWSGSAWQHTLSMALLLPE